MKTLFLSIILLVSTTVFAENTDSLYFEKWIGLWYTCETCGKDKKITTIELDTIIGCKDSLIAKYIGCSNKEVEVRTKISTKGDSLFNGKNVFILKDEKLVGNIADKNLEWKRNVGDVECEGVPPPIYYYSTINVKYSDGEVLQTGTINCKYKDGTTLNFNAIKNGSAKSVNEILSTNFGKEILITVKDKKGDVLLSEIEEVLAKEIDLVIEKKEKKALDSLPLLVTDTIVEVSLKDFNVILDEKCITNWKRTSNNNLVTLKFYLKNKLNDNRIKIILKSKNGYETEIIKFVK